MEFTLRVEKQQMVVILTGMFVAAAVIVVQLPPSVNVVDAARLSGALGRVNIIDFSLDPNTRYTFWSGITGGFFLSLSYFGTDQSQVQRYLGGASLTESRLGLLFNGLLKIPMQMLILCIGLLVFTFHIFDKPPILFNGPALAAVENTAYAPALAALETRWDAAFEERKAQAERMVAGEDSQVALQAAQAEMDGLRTEVKALVSEAVPGAEVKDADYIFIRFVLHQLPPGLVGLLLAAILMAAMSSTASELSALGSTSVVDGYKRLINPDADDRHTVRVSQAFTVFWGLLAVAFATFASLLDNLIQAVNILGSIFYGVVLGIFLVAFFLRRVGGTAVLVGAIIAQLSVIALFFASDIGFLWFNVIGCLLVVFLSFGVQALPGVSPARSTP